MFNMKSFIITKMVHSVSTVNLSHISSQIFFTVHENLHWMAVVVVPTKDRHIKDNKVYYYRTVYIARNYIINKSHALFKHNVSLFIVSA